ncbi:MAG: discoidin domain-containing protein [Armatimonadota bacterium]
MGEGYDAMRGKTFLCAPIAMAVAFVLLSIPPAFCEQQPATNIALHRPFHCSVGILEGWTGLVDGDVSSDSAPGCFATANAEKFPKRITIDLGALCKIKQVVVHNSANGNTRKISIECSTGGDTFETLRDAFIFPDRTATKLSHEFSPRRARYVRLTFYDTWGSGPGGDNCIFLREVEVHGWHPDGVRQQPADPLAQFSGQKVFHGGQSVNIFRRYCLQNPDTPLRIGAFGDSFARPRAGRDEHWVAVLGQKLQQATGKPMTLQLAASMGFTATDCEIALDEADDDFDLILLTIGFDAAIGEEDPGTFENNIEKIMDTLYERTDALVLGVTPLPVAHEKTLKNYELIAGVNTTKYAWKLREVAEKKMMPLVMTGPLLASSTQGFTELYSDNMGLSEQGHKTLAAGIARILTE